MDNATHSTAPHTCTIERKPRTRSAGRYQCIFHSLESSQRLSRVTAPPRNRASNRSRCLAGLPALRSSLLANAPGANICTLVLAMRFWCSHCLYLVVHERCHVASHSIEKTAIFRHVYHLLRQKPKLVWKTVEELWKSRWIVVKRERSSIACKMQSHQHAPLWSL